jgi:hypothetical protein
MPYSEVLRKAGSWFFFRLACFLLLMVIVHRVPGWVKGPLWLAVFFAGLWSFRALIRESGPAADFLIPRLEHGKQWLAEWSRKHESKWRMVTLICAVGIAVITIYRAWPTWEFMATSSLREDEILNIANYTSRGFIPSVSTYKLARNHVFYNVLSTALPGAASTVPLRARLVSFLSVISALLLLVAYAKSRGWFLAGLASAGLVAGNFFTAEVILEARGYGFIFLCAMLSCVAFAEWLRIRSRVWLKILAAACVLGTYTLSFCIVFGGILLLLAFCYRPSRDTLLTCFLSAAAIAMLYLPIAGDLYKVFRGYSLNYGREMSNFDSIDGVFRTLQYFLPHELMQINALLVLVLTFLVLLYVAFGRFARASDRLSVAGVGAAVLGFLAFCLFCKTVPIRVSAYMAAPLAFLCAVLVGSTLSARSLMPFRSFAQIGFSLFVMAALGKSQISEPLIAKQNWRDIAVFIERAFPQGTRVWMGDKYGRLLQWNLASRNMPEQGSLDEVALGSGRLVVVEGLFKDDDEQKRLRWKDLPEGVRYVTIPLRKNYQRVFFFPPTPRGIASISVDNRTLNPCVCGRQPYDPGLLAQSAGHGDFLRLKDEGSLDSGPSSIQEAPVVEPAAMSLPAVMSVELEPGAAAGTCNLLFSQSLEDKSISAEVQKAEGAWRATSNVFVLGELASVALGEGGCKAVRIRFEKDPSVLKRIRAPRNTTRPSFGLIDAWIAPGSARGRYEPVKN